MSSSGESPSQPEHDTDLVEKYEQLLQEYTDRATVVVDREMREGKYGPTLQEFAPAVPPRHLASNA